MSNGADSSHPSIFRIVFVALLLLVIFPGSTQAQQTLAVPQLVRLSGALSSITSSDMTVAFALYKDGSGGAPLWQEVQSVALDPTGHYSVLLGARSPSGIPPELFATGESRWLGVSVQGQAEQPRVLLVSVPYAMKASDAETLGGLPASAYLQRSELTTLQSGALLNSAAITAAAQSVAAATSVATVAGNLPMYADTAGTLTGSSIYQASSGNVGIGTQTPAGMLTLLATNPTMRIENYSGTNTASPGSPNFNFYTANGTQGSPSGTLAGDNLGQFAASGYVPASGTVPAGFPSSSRVKINFAAAENWSSTAQGTAIYFSTTLAGGTSRGPRMIIDGNGNVGIGNGSSNNPAATDKLYVNGDVKTAGNLLLSTTGRVGIGTAAPQYALDVNGTANFTGTVNFASPVTFATTAAGATQGAVDFAIGSNGDVGIGTSSPQSKLDVNGGVTIDPQASTSGANSWPLNLSDTYVNTTQSFQWQAVPQPLAVLGSPATNFLNLNFLSSPTATPKNILNIDQIGDMQLGGALSVAPQGASGGYFSWPLSLSDVYFNTTQSFQWQAAPQTVVALGSPSTNFLNLNFLSSPTATPKNVLNIDQAGDMQVVGVLTASTLSGSAISTTGTVTAVGVTAGSYAINGTTFDWGSSVNGNSFTGFASGPDYATLTGARNTADGLGALEGITGGSENVAVGYLAGFSDLGGVSSRASVTLSNGNTFLGAYSQPEAPDQPPSISLSNATGVGAYTMVAQSNSLVLGCMVGVGFCPGAVKVGIGTNLPTNILTIVSGSGHAVADGWDTYSSRRWKNNIETLHGALGKIEKLRGVSYNLKESGKHEIGVIAEEVGAVVPEVVSWEENGTDARGVDYSRLTALLIEATKEQQKLIREQQAQLKAQQTQLRAQQSQIAELDHQVREVKATLRSRRPARPELHSTKATISVVRQ